MTKLAHRLLGALALSFAISLAPSPSAHAADLIAIITATEDNPFFRAQALGAQTRARELGYDTLMLVHGESMGRQNELVDLALSRKARAIILENAGSAVNVSAVRRARLSSVPTFLIDRPLDAGGQAMAQILSDNAQGARLGAQAFARLMQAQGTYAELVGRETDANALIRSKGYQEVLDAQPGLKRVARVVANWSRTEAAAAVKKILEQQPDLKGLIAGNDTMALGALDAAVAAGRQDLIVVGFDGSDDARDSILRGGLKATVLQPAVRQAQVAVELADRYLRTSATGQPERQLLECELIDASNAQRLDGFVLR